MAVIRSCDEAFEEFRRIFLKMLEKMQALLSVDRPRGAELLQMALTWTSAKSYRPRTSGTQRASPTNEIRGGVY
ncbi:MAG: hypothetical protein ACFCD0_28975 [Gemmataceae bacterium]